MKKYSESAEISTEVADKASWNPTKGGKELGLVWKQKENSQTITNDIYVAVSLLFIFMACRLQPYSFIFIFFTGSFRAATNCVGISSTRRYC